MKSEDELGMKFFDEYGKFKSGPTALSELNEKLFALVSDFLDNECDDCPMLELTLLENVIPDCINIHIVMNVALKHFKHSIAKKGVKDG